MAKSFYPKSFFILERGKETNLKTSWTQRGLGLNVKACFSPPLYVAQTQCFSLQVPIFLRGCWDFRVSSRTMLIQGLTLQRNFTFEAEITACDFQFHRAGGRLLCGKCSDAKFTLWHFLFSFEGLLSDFYSGLLVRLRGGKRADLKRRKSTSKQRENRRLVQ